MGAFVSGLDAGSIYQTWPLMNNSYVPDDLTFNSFEASSFHAEVILKKIYM